MRGQGIGTEGKEGEGEGREKGKDRIHLTKIQDPPLIKSAD